MNWLEFVKTMELIEARTIQSKIDLFLEVMDTNKNGEL